MDLLLSQVRYAWYWVPHCPSLRPGKFSAATVLNVLYCTDLSWKISSFFELEDWRIFDHWQELVQLAIMHRMCHANDKQRREGLLRDLEVQFSIFNSNINSKIENITSFYFIYAVPFYLIVWVMTKPVGIAPERRINILKHDRRVNLEKLMPVTHVWRILIPIPSPQDQFTPYPISRPH